MATPCGALGAALSGAVRCGTAVTRLERRGAGFVVHTPGGEVGADAVVLAVPAYVQRELLAPLDAACAELLAQVPYPPLAVLCLGYRRADVAHPLDGFGFLVPRREGIRILGALFESTLFAGRAPDGHVLVRAMIGGAINPEECDRGDEALLQTVRDDLRATVGIDVAPVFARIYRHEWAIPQYTPGHADRVAELEQRAAAIGPLVLSGNAYRGISLNDCVKNARPVAAQALTRLPAA